MQSKPPSWFADKLKHLAQTGKLDLSGEAFDDLSFVGSRPSMKQLDLSFTPIQTIQGLSLQPKLDTLIADSSELVNFKNFRAVQKISSISIRNTPASHLPNFKLSLLIVIGPSLRVINGQYISAKLREKASQYPPIASDLINCGWIAEYPCPNESDMEEISRSYGLADIEEDLDEIPANFQQQNSIDLEKTVDYYSSVHKRIIQQAHQQIKDASLDFEAFQLPPFEKNDQVGEENSFLNGLEDDIGLNLCDKVQILLHHHGYNVDKKNRAESMIKILSELLEIDSQESLIGDEKIESNVEANFQINKPSKSQKIESKQVESKHKEIKFKEIKRNENESNENGPSENTYFESGPSENKKNKINQNKKKLNQGMLNESIDQAEKSVPEKKLNKNKTKESVSLIEKKKKPSKRIDNEIRESKLSENEFIEDDINNDNFSENDTHDHTNDSYNDNSNSNYNNSFGDNYNLNNNNDNDNDYDYDDLDENYNSSKQNNDYSSFNRNFNQKTKNLKKNNNNFGGFNDSNDNEYDTFNEDAADVSYSREYYTISFNHGNRDRLDANDNNDYEIDNEDTEKEVDINFDSISKEQMSTSGIDKQIFDLADRCSSQSDINDKEYQREDLKWKEFVAQLKNDK